jgi:RNA polymerase sigma-70 factor, ECF subfamily
VPESQNQHPSEMDRWQFLDEAVQKLPSAQRVPLVLYHFEEMSYEDIATRLKISLSKVKTDIHRGRDALHRRLKLLGIGEDEWSLFHSNASPGGSASAHSN